MIGGPSALDGVPAELLAADGHAWLRIGEMTACCTSPGCVDWIRQANGMARLSVVDGPRIVASVEYFGGDRSGVPPEVDFTMTSTEDFDFGEFVCRALGDLDRLRRVLGSDVAFDNSATMNPAARADDARLN